MVIEMVDGKRVDVPEDKIVVAWANPDDEAAEPYAVFDQDLPEKGICSYGVYDTPIEFLKAWCKMVHNPDGMWYWVMDGGDCICSGACDPEDLYNFEENFGLEGVFSARYPKCFQELSTKTFRRMVFDCHIETLGQFFQHTDEDLLRIKNLGPRTLAEVKEKVGAFLDSYERFLKKEKDAVGVEKESLEDQIRLSSSQKVVPTGKKNDKEEWVR